MTAPWIAAVVCLWVVVIGLTLVTAGLLRRVASVLEALPAGGTPAEERKGPPVGAPLPTLEVQHRGGDTVRLSDLAGPVVLAVLSSQCDPCLAIAGWLSVNEVRLDGLTRLVVLSDREGGERLGLPESITLLTDDRNLAIRDLEVPGTPFAVEVGADRRVVSSTLLSGPDHLVGLIERAAARSSSSGSPGARLPVLPGRVPARHEVEGLRAAPAE